MQVTRNEPVVISWDKLMQISVYGCEIRATQR